MRVSTGVPGFDQLVEGGLLSGRLYLLSGPPGSGKTTFCSRFLTKGAQDGQNSLYLSMHETEDELVADMGGYDFGFKDAMETKRLQFLNILTERSQRLLIPRNGGDYRSNVQQMTERITSFLNKYNVQRMAIDSTMLLRYFYDGDDKTFIQFISGLKQSDATILLISEMTDPTAYADEHYLAHGVIFMHNYLKPSGMQRGVQIIKMRGTDIDSDIRRISFSDQGVKVHPDERVEG